MCSIRIRLQSRSIKTIITWYNIRYIWGACVVDSTTLCTTNYKLHILMYAEWMAASSCNANKNISILWKKNEPLLIVYSALYATICECCVELREKWMVLIRSLLLYILSLIFSLFPTHTSKASQRIAVICCCAWIFFRCWLCFVFILVFMLCALNILYYYPWRYIVVMRASLLAVCLIRTAVQMWYK